MWIPNDAAEVERAAQAGELEETSVFDAKAHLPETRKNMSLATDVAAMTTDGGVLLYGIGEDEDQRPTLPQPITLAGAADRVGQIVSTSITEVPHIDVRELPLADDPSRGYLLVIVPQSARAPHQVIVNGDGRFYGRSAKANRVLNEGDVARLYERRQRWHVSGEELLAQVIADAPLRREDPYGFVHAFAWPVAEDANLLERVMAMQGGAQDTYLWLRGVMHSTLLANSYSPGLDHAGYWRRHGAGAWRLASLSPDELREVTDGRESKWDPTNLASMDLYLNGRVDLFCGRATDARRGSGERMLLEGVLAGNMEVLFTVGHRIYETAGYFGAVNVGVAVTGIRGSYSAWLGRTMERGTAYPQERYVRVDRVSASELQQPAAVCHRLMRHLFEATTGVAGHDPFAEAARQRRS